MHSRVAKSNALSFFILSLVAGDGAGLEKGSMLEQKAGLEGAGTRWVPGPGGDWSTGWKKRLAPGACPLLRPTQSSSFMSRPGLRWEDAVERRFSRESGVGKGPV